MKRVLANIKKCIYYIMSTTLGRFLFEAITILCLVIGMVYLYYHSQIILGSIVLFCLVGNILSLIDKYKKK